ncbi:MAG TPA: sulfite exporter TauE/SafE family protein [Patescibacteria group bacterium]
MGNTNLITIFTTGLFVGGLTCLAVQGGLLAATLAQREQEKLEEKAKNGKALPILTFLLAKLIAYTLLGAFLGWLGSLFKLSLTAQVILQFTVIIFMLGTALNLLNVHPIFRYFVIQPPRFLTSMVRKQSKRNDIFAPAVLGAFTIFIPCGTTQAMMALSIASGNPLAGAAILFAFILGTSPVFFILGYFTMRLGDLLQQRFMKVAATVLILLALFNLDATLALSGSPVTFSTILKKSICVISYCSSNSAEGGQPVSEQTITITSSGYTPNNFVVKSGSTVKLDLVNQGGVGCVQAFTIPSLNLQKIVPPGQTDSFTFTAPNKPGNIAFMCSMGMYSGTIKVI